MVRGGVRDVQVRGRGVGRMKSRAVVIGSRRVLHHFILISKRRRFGTFDAMDILVRFDGQIDFVLGKLMSRSGSDRDVSIFVHLTGRIVGQTDSLFHLTRIDHTSLPFATSYRSFCVNG